MSRIHTHYDNLNVARNAPFEVIQAAYRALSLKYHPDRNPDNPEAARIMAVINAAYTVLSDTSKRAEHDQWIARQEAAQPESSAAASRASAAGASAGQGPGASSTGQTFRQPGADQNGSGRNATAQGSAGSGRGAPRPPADVGAHVRKYWFVYVAAVLLAWKIWWTNTRPVEPPPQTTQSTTQSTPLRPAAPGAKRPASGAERIAPALPEAPAREPVPEPVREPEPRAGEPEAGKSQAAAFNRCRVIVDNRLGGVPLVARLVRQEGGRDEVVREFAVPARGEVNVRDVAPGSYVVRYRNPSTGETKKTEPFTLHETQTAEGVRSDVLTFTTYSVKGGNMRTTPIGEGEF
jgi:DnaJ-class molecular chaperone with C-terminal Zn finger domain